MIKYNKITDEITGKITIQRFNEDGSVSYFPNDEANSDYQAYLATLASESAPTAQ